MFAIVLHSLKKKNVLFMVGNAQNIFMESDLHLIS